MIVQEPIQAAVWHCMNNYAYSDATFLAERLLAEVNTEESLFLLATVYYRSGKTKRAYNVIKNTGFSSPQLRHLLATCCYDLEQFDEAERALTGSSSLKSNYNLQDIQKEYGSIACFVVKLLGLISLRTERLSRAYEMLKGSLKLNPFLWNSFASLCENGDKPDPSKVFRLDNIDNFSNIHGTTITSVLNNSAGTTPNTGGAINSPSKPSLSNEAVLQKVPTKEVPVAVQPQNPQIIAPLSTPYSSHLTTVSAAQHGIISTPLQYSMASLNTPISANLSLYPGATGTVDLNTKQKKSVRFGRISPITPHFGVLPLNLSCAGESDSSCLSSFALLSPSPLSISQLDSQSNKIQQVNKRILCRNTKDSPLATNKQAVFAPTGNNSNVSNPSSGQAHVRRSSRLFGNGSSVKVTLYFQLKAEISNMLCQAYTEAFPNFQENNKNRCVAPKSPARKSKPRSVKSQSSLTELNEKNKNENEIISGEKTLSEKCSGSPSLSFQALTIQKQSAEGLMSLLRDIGASYQELVHYNCKKAVKLFSELPIQHSNSTWVLAHIGKAYFEMNDHEEAVKYFSQVREKDSNHLQYMECYSTAMWHLQKESQLSALAQDLLDIDKESPEAWCAAGNCFSLQKEHDAAIKYFGRAIQVDPYFAYSYSLLGHEHLAMEALEKALSCYRSAIRLDKRHYNSWYGIGLVFLKQERFAQSEWYFRKAAQIHPQSSVLLCHIAFAQHTQNKSEAALETLNRAMEIDSINPLCKYHKATILLALDRYQEALDELLHLKQLIPRESNVYFLLGKAYKRLGDIHLALMNFSWAIDLDPKGANNQYKETIDPAASCYPVEDDQINNNPQETASFSDQTHTTTAEVSFPPDSRQESLILEQSSDLSGVEELAITPNPRGGSRSTSDTAPGMSRAAPPVPRSSGVLASTSHTSTSGLSQAGTSTPGISVLSTSATMHLSNSSMHTPNALNAPQRSMRMIGMVRHPSFNIDFGSLDDSLQSPNQDSQDTASDEVL